MEEGRSTFEVFSKVLFQYGPFALTLLLLYKGHSAAKKNKEDALLQSDRLERRSAQWLYITVWAVIFACLSFSSYVWYRINVQIPVVIRGEFTNLGSGDEVDFRPIEIYRKEDTFANRKKVQWTYISSSPITDKFILELIVQKSPASGSMVEPGETLFFRIPLDRSTLNRFVRVDYQGDKITVQIDGQDERLVLGPIWGGI